MCINVDERKITIIDKLCASAALYLDPTILGTIKQENSNANDDIH